MPSPVVLNPPCLCLSVGWFLEPQPAALGFLGNFWIATRPGVSNVSPGSPPPLKQLQTPLGKACLSSTLKTPLATTPSQGYWCQAPPPECDPPVWTLSARACAHNKVCLSSMVLGASGLYRMVLKPQTQGLNSSPRAQKWRALLSQNTPACH